MNKKNIIIAVNSQLIKEIVSEYYSNENLIVLNYPADIFNLGTLTNAILILEYSFLNDIGFHYLYLLSEDKNINATNILLITSNKRTKALLSFTLSNVIISDPEEFTATLNLLKENTLFFPTKTQFFNIAVSKKELEKK